MIDMKRQPDSAVPLLPTPGAGRVLMFVDKNGALACKDETGKVSSVGTPGYVVLFVDVAVTKAGTTSRLHGIENGVNIIEWVATLVNSSGQIIRPGDGLEAQKFTVIVTTETIEVTCIAKATQVIGKTVRVALWIKG